MPELSDYQALLARQDAQKKTEHVHELRTLLPRVTEITHKAQSVVDHPGWHLYLDKLETHIQDIERRRVTTTQSMVHGTAMGHELELLKIELNVMDAEIRGLRYAASLAPQMIDLGNQIATGVGRSAAGSSADHSRVVTDQGAANLKGVGA